MQSDNTVARRIFRLNFGMIGTRALVLLSLAVCSIMAEAQTTSIAVNGANSGRVFDGIGAISGGGGNSRLLYDYPSAQQSAILDYLFKPGAGASLQILKVEIGGGDNSTSGSESSIEYVDGAVSCNTGYEWWLMRQALARNPNIKFYALAWTVPGWLDGWYNTDAIDYLVSYLTCAKSNGVPIGYLGGWNENSYGNAAWWEQLRSTLDNDGFSSVEFVGGDDFGFGVATAIKEDTTGWASIMPIIGSHYPCGYLGSIDNCTLTSNSDYNNAIALGAKLWTSEGGSEDYNTGAPGVIRSITRGYIDASLTEFNNWPVIASIYPYLPWPTEGLIWADQPWSGWYSVGATTAVIAQVTQFTQPGWTFIDSASGYLGGSEQNGTYVTLKSTNGADYSTIIETTTATAPQTVKITVSGGLSTGTVDVWATNLGSGSQSNWFVKQPSITPAGGSYSLTVQPNYIYSISTIAGQGFSTETGAASEVMPLPYSDSFSSYAIGSSAKYLANLEGDFQSQPCVAISGNCIEQVVPEAPSELWNSGVPQAGLGDDTWSNYTVSVNALFEQDSTIFLDGLMSGGGFQNGTSNASDAGYPNFMNGYSLTLSNTGAWSLLNDTNATTSTSPLASGSVTAPGLNKWVTLSMTFTNSTIGGSINGTQVASVTDSTYTAGQVGFGVEGWQMAQFSNLSITPGAPACTPTAIAPYISVSGTWVEESRATVASGTIVDLGPQPVGGTWSWTGPNGFTSTARQIDSIALSMGSNVYTATYTNSSGCTSKQPFTITVAAVPTTGSYTEIVSENSGMCLSAVNTTEGTQLEQVTCDASTLQEWELSIEGSGYYIANEDTGMVADDSGQSKIAGGAVVDWVKNGGTNQQWTFTSNGSGYYTIVNVDSGLCLDVTGASKTSGALVEQWTCNGQANQLWKQ